MAPFTINPVFTDHGVFQAGKPIRVFGETKAPPEDYISNDLLWSYVSDGPIEDRHFKSRDGWVKCNWETVGYWSAIGFYAGDTIQKAQVCEEVPNTHLIISADVSSPMEVHPSYKREVSERLAKEFLYEHQ